MDNSLLLLASEVRSKTLWLLEGLTDETARFTAPGLVNSILWHAGHVFVVVESLRRRDSRRHFPMAGSRRSVGTATREPSPIGRRSPKWPPHCAINCPGSRQRLRL